MDFWKNVAIILAIGFGTMVLLDWIVGFFFWVRLGRKKEDIKFFLAHPFFILANVLFKK